MLARSHDVQSSPKLTEPPPGGTPSGTPQREARTYVGRNCVDREWFLHPGVNSLVEGQVDSMQDELHMSVHYFTLLFVTFILPFNIPKLTHMDQ